MINYNENETEYENGSHRYDINRTRPRHGHKYTEYKTCTSMMVVMCNKRQATSEAEFMKNLSTTELKKSVAYKKRVQQHLNFRVLFQNRETHLP